MFIWALEGSTYAVSVYRDGQKLASEFLQWLEDTVGKWALHCAVVIGGDFNIHAKVAGAQRNQNGGRRLEGFVASLEEDGGELLNNGSMTYKDFVGSNRDPPRRHSPIDITMFLPEAGRVGEVRCMEWCVGDQEMSDHCQIRFEVVTPWGWQDIPDDTSDREGGEATQPSCNMGYDVDKKAFAEVDDDVRDSCEQYVRGRLMGDLAYIFEDEVGAIEACNVAKQLLFDMGLKFKLLKKKNRRRQRPKHRLYSWNPACDAARKARMKAQQAYLSIQSIPEEDRDENWRQVRNDAKAERLMAETEAVRVINKASRDDWTSAIGRLTCTTPTSEVYRLAKGLSKCGKGRKRNVVKPLRGEGGQVLCTAEEQVQAFGRFYADRSSRSHPDNERFCEQTRVSVENEVHKEGFYQDDDCEYQSVPYTLKEVEEGLARMRASAPGKDGITKELVRLAGGGFPVLIQHCFNLNLSEGVRPEEWMTATVIPLPKHTDSPCVELKDYRPVSLLAFLGKWEEQVVYARLEWEIWRAKGIGKTQHAYCRHRSAPHLIARKVQAIHDAWEKNEELLFVGVDIARAFDTVWWEGVLHRLHTLGIRGALLKWIRVYLSERHNSVRAGDVESPAEFLWELGVPQGGVLAPLLFAIYIDPLLAVGEGITESGGFADDTAVFINLPREEPGRAVAIGKLEEVLEKMMQWCKKWRLTIAPMKTEVMRFTKWGLGNSPQVTMTIGGSQVTESGAAIRYLGVWLDPELTWSTHVDKVSARVQARLRALRSVAGREFGADRETLRTLYAGWIRPVMEYASQAWAGARADLLKKLQQLQNEALRCIAGVHSTTNLTALHMELELPHLARRRLQAGACMGAKLNRLGDYSTTSRCWHAWKSKWGGTRGARNLSVFPEIEYRRPNGGRRLGPIEFCQQGLRALAIEEDDVNPAPLMRREHVHEVRRPWMAPEVQLGEDGCKLSPRPLKYPWPVMQAAGKRNTVGTKAALDYTYEVIEECMNVAKNNKVRLLLAFIDASAELEKSILSMKREGRGGGGSCGVV